MLLWDKTLVEAQLSGGGRGPEAELGRRSAQKHNVTLHLVYFQG